MLITAGDEVSHNTMTASWGGLGIMWAKSRDGLYPSAPYTKEFVDRNDRFTISFYKEEYRKHLLSVDANPVGTATKRKKHG